MEQGRANVTIPNDAKDMVNWLVKYDRRFQGRLASVLSYLVSEGALAVYQKGLDEATPLEPETYSALVEHSSKALDKAVIE